MDVRERISLLRQRMTDEGIDYVLIGSSDYHASEYVGDYFKVSEFFSGCTSDNVTLIIGADIAELWTDGRYFISAENELKGSVRLAYDFLKVQFDVDVEKYDQLCELNRRKAKRRWEKKKHADDAAAFSAMHKKENEKEKRASGRTARTCRNIRSICCRRNSSESPLNTKPRGSERLWPKRRPLISCSQSSTI